MQASKHYPQLCGIIGGLGPQATNYLFNLIIKLKPAKKDQDHLPVLIFNNPQIPDRTKHLTKNEVSPLPELIHTAKVLKKAGATFLAIPCNTCHAFVTQIELKSNLPVLNMPFLAVRYILKKYGKKAQVGLLATDGTLKSQIYESELKNVSLSIKLIVPDALSQKNVMEAIYGVKGIKAGFTDSYENYLLLEKAAQDLFERGADVVIQGCTEIPLAFLGRESQIPMVDPMEILAKEIILKTSRSKLAVVKNPDLVKTYLQ